MNRIALGLEYDGSQFCGWQRQKNKLSVQAALENALSQVANTPISTVCAGRTDAGVHATGQVVHFDTNVVRSERAWVYGANTVLSRLSQGVRVLWIKNVLNNFDARRSAISRRYRYIIYNHPLRPSLLRQYVTWEHMKLDVQSILEASQYWLGEHDFSSFRGSGCQSLSPIRTIHAIKFLKRNDYIIVEFMANAFLQHMVRNMIGVLLKIGRGTMGPEWAKAVLLKKDRREAGVTAQPMGLYLVEVQYPKVFAIPELPLGPWFLNLNEDDFKE
jgi:tRNA pseudouridine38-40 synthase